MTLAGTVAEAHGRGEDALTSSGSRVALAIGVGAGAVNYRPDPLLAHPADHRDAVGSLRVPVAGDLVEPRPAHQAARRRWPSSRPARPSACRTSPGRAGRSPLALLGPDRAPSTGGRCSRRPEPARGAARRRAGRGGAGGDLRLCAAAGGALRLPRPASRAAPRSTWGRSTC